MRMPIEYSHLTLHEIAIFWAREDAGGESIIEQRRLTEILELLRNAWRNGELKTNLDLEQVLSTQIRLTDEGLLPALGAQQARFETFHRKIDESQVERSDFYGWLKTRKLDQPSFWLRRKLEAIHISDGAEPTADGARQPFPKRKTGPRNEKAIRVMAGIKAGLASGEISLDQLHDDPMKLFEARFGVSRPTVDKVVKLLRLENPRKPA